MSLLENKVCIVTGASRGIGRGISLRLGEAGARLVISGRDQKELAKTSELLDAKGIESFAIAGDITDEEFIKSLLADTVKHYGRFDCAINNAGVEGDMKPIYEQSNENFDKVFSTNVKSVYQCMKHQIIYFKNNAQAGAIVNIASLAGFRGFPTASFYVASKHAVLGLTKSAALECALEGIRVNAISPGGVDTGMLDRFLGNDANTKDEFAKAHAMGRLGKPEEIGDSCIFLCSEHSSFITGQNIIVDGGFTT